MALRSRLLCSALSLLPELRSLKQLQPCCNAADRLMHSSSAVLDSSHQGDAPRKPRKFDFSPAQNADGSSGGGDAAKAKSGSWADVMKRVSGPRSDRRKLDQTVDTPTTQRAAQSAPPKWLSRVRADAQSETARTATPAGNEDDYSPLGTVGARRPPAGDVAATPVRESDGARSLRESLRRDSDTGSSINATFEYFAGATYVSTDLNPYARMAAQQKRFSKKRRQQMDVSQSQGQAHPSQTTFTDREIRAYSDFRNIHMLRMFIHDGSGAIKGRERRLFRAATHRKTARAIKTARTLALLPFVGRHPYFEAPESLRMRTMFEQHDKDVRTRDARAGAR